jgi:hypothetical protein
LGASIGDSKVRIISGVVTNPGRLIDYYDARGPLCMRRLARDFLTISPSPPMTHSAACPQDSTSHPDAPATASNHPVQRASMHASASATTAPPSTRCAPPSIDRRTRCGCARRNGRRAALARSDPRTARKPQRGRCLGAGRLDPARLALRAAQRVRAGVSARADVDPWRAVRIVERVELAPLPVGCCRARLRRTPARSSTVHWVRSRLVRSLAAAPCGERVGRCGGGARRSAEASRARRRTYGLLGRVVRRLYDQLDRWSHRPLGRARRARWRWALDQ